MNNRNNKEDKRIGLIDRFKSEIWWICQKRKTAKRRKENWISLKDRIVYSPIVCDFHLTDYYGDIHAEYRFYRSGLVSSLLDIKDHFTITEEQIEKLIHLLNENGILYMGDLSDLECDDGCSYYIYFFDKYGHVVTKAGGSNPYDLEFLEVIAYIEDLIVPNTKFRENWEVNVPDEE